MFKSFSFIGSELLNILYAYININKVPSIMFAMKSHLRSLYLHKNAPGVFYSSFVYCFNILGSFSFLFCQTSIIYRSQWHPTSLFHQCNCDIHFDVSINITVIFILM